MSDDYASDEWLGQSMPCILEAQNMMEDQLSDNPANLVHQLTKAESMHSRITKLLADANARLDEAEYHALMSVRDDDLKVAERNIVIAKEVVNHRRMRDIIDGLADSIKNRLILGMNLRKQNAGERSDW